MPSIAELVTRTIRITAEAAGIDQTSASLQKLAASQSGVAVASDTSSKSVLSAEGALKKLQLAVDAEFRSTEKLTLAQKTLNDAMAQGLLGKGNAALLEHNRLLDLAATKYRAVSTESKGFFSGLGMGEGGAKALLGGLGLGLGLSELMELPSKLQEVVHSAAEIPHVAETIGTTTKNLQELYFAGQEVHIPIDTMNSALEKFSKNLGDASRGGGDLYKILQANHVAISGDFMTDFKSVANLIEHASNAEDRNALITKLFGRNAQEMGLLFKEGAAGIDVASDAAEKWGAVYSDDKLKRAEEIDKRWTDFANTLSVNVRSAMLSVADAADTMSTHMAGIGTTLDTLVSKPSWHHLEEFIFGKAPPGARGMWGLEAPTVLDAGTVTNSYNPLSGNRTGLAVRPTVLPSTTPPDHLRKQFDDALKSTEKQTAALRAQAASFNMTTGAAAAFQKEQELLNLADQNHIAHTPAMLAAIHKQAEAYGQVTEQMEKMQQARQAMDDLAGKGFDAFMQVATGAQKATDAIKDFIIQLVEAQARADFLRIFDPTSAPGPLSAIFGAGASAAAAPIVSSVGAGLFHAGGMVGSGGVQRWVHPAYFDHAPRLHRGLAADEFPAILQRGERVIPRGGSADGQSTGGLTVHFHGPQNREDVHAGVLQALAEFERHRGPAMAVKAVAEARRHGTRVLR